ncbi:MAG: hypothetical protein JWM91_878 [Rhodospirillales bacterium]|nr:hypothetical protein [Rhodospirillales bacterium]
MVRPAEPNGADGPVFGTGVPTPELPPGFSAPPAPALLLVDWASDGPVNARMSADAAKMIFMMPSTVCSSEYAFPCGSPTNQPKFRSVAEQPDKGRLELAAIGTSVPAKPFLFDRHAGRTLALQSGAARWERQMRETTAEVSKIVAAPPAEVWRALTTPELLKAFFFGADVKSRWKLGDPITMSGSFKDKAYEDKGKILGIEPEKRLEFSHWSPLAGTADSPENYHVVSFTLTPQRKNTKVTLVQSNLTGEIKPGDREHRAEYEKNWQGVLDGLADLFSDGR